MTVPKSVVAWIQTLMVFLAIAAFAVMFATAIVQVWSATAGKPPQYDQPYLYVASGLAALVGGIFAVAFGVKSPDPQKPGMSSAQLNFHTLASVPAKQPIVSVTVGIVYLMVYLVLGLAAVATWVIHPNEISDLVKNLGTTFLGLALPIVAAAFQPAT